MNGVLDNASHDLSPTDHSPLNVTSPTYIFNEVNEFQKGIKCDISLYPIFKDDQQYNSWYCDTYAIASVHGTETFSFLTIALPKTLQALLWLEVKHFMLSVFCKNLQTPVGHMLDIIIIVIPVMLNQLLKNYVIIVKSLFMPKLMHKMFALALPTYILPHGKEHSNHSSTIRNPNSYSLIRVHHLAIKNSQPFTKVCYVTLSIQIMIFYRSNT